MRNMNLEEMSVGDSLLLEMKRLAKSQLKENNLRWQHYEAVAMDQGSSTIRLAGSGLE